jgi:succinate dehydrogenase / fumarate reductase, flavoprotein subunit
VSPTETTELDARIPSGPVADKWHDWLDAHRLVGPRRRGDHTVIVVGTGLAGASAAATLAGQGYKVKSFCFQDSPRRAHSIAAQGGINATKDYANEGDSVQRLFVDTMKGGDFRAREANVWRLAELSANIIDQAVAQGVPFNREYGGLLATRSFGGVLVERTFYCRGQTGQQLLLGAYSALQQQVNAGGAQVFSRHEMMDIVLVDGQARGIIARDLLTGELQAHAADAVVLATGGYCNAYFLSTNAKGCNVTAIWRAHRRGAAMANPCFTQIHPTCIPQSGEYQSKLTLMSESLRNDGRIWVPRNPEESRPPKQIPEEDRYYYLEERYPRYGNLTPRDVASRAAKTVCDEGLGVGPTGRGVYLDFRDAIAARGREEIASRYGNLFELYERITGESPWEVPMRIYPAPHYSMGGLWVDYELQTTIPGLFAIGEANFSDHGANRLGASAMMQCLADGYFIAPHTVTHYLGAIGDHDHVDTDHAAFVQTRREVEERLRGLMSVGGATPAAVFHRELGQVMLDKCGMARNAEGLGEGLGQIHDVRESFWSDLRVDGEPDGLNQSLEYAGRVSDFFELSELMCRDALARDESCGCHLREEHQTEDGEAMRDDQGHAHVAVWDYQGEGVEPRMRKEELAFEATEPVTRSYK